MEAKMKIDRDASIALRGARKTRARFHESIEPTDSLKAYLDNLFEENEDYGVGTSALDRHAVDAEIWWKGGTGAGRRRKSVSGFCPSGSSRPPSA